MGWIKIDRQITDNWVWKAEPFSRGQAWIDLIMKATHEDSSIPFNNHPLQLKRGQLVTSVRKLSKEWQWGKDKVLSFLRDLESENMILRDAQTVHATVLTIVKYDDFQSRTDNDKDNHRDNSKDNGKDNHKDNDPPHSRTKEHKNIRTKEIKETATPIWGLPDWSDGDYEEISYEK